MRTNPEVMGEAVEFMNQYPGLGLAQAEYLRDHPEMLPIFVRNLEVGASVKLEQPAVME